jgi:hypothetical protein
MVMVRVPRALLGALRRAAAAGLWCDRRRADAQRLGLDVEIGPAKRQYFAAAGAGGTGDGDDREKDAAAEGIEQGAQLVLIERLAVISLCPCRRAGDAPIGRRRVCPDARS